MVYKCPALELWQSWSLLHYTLFSDFECASCNFFNVHPALTGYFDKPTANRALQSLSCTALHDHDLPALHRGPLSGGLVYMDMIVDVGVRRIAGGSLLNWKVEIKSDRNLGIVHLHTFLGVEVILIII